MCFTRQQAPNLASRYYVCRSRSLPCLQISNTFSYPRNEQHAPSVFSFVQRWRMTVLSVQGCQSLVAASECVAAFAFSGMSSWPQGAVTDPASGAVSSASWWQPPRAQLLLVNTCVFCGANDSGGAGANTRSFCARKQCRFLQESIPRGGQRFPSCERNRSDSPWFTVVPEPVAVVPSAFSTGGASSSAVPPPPARRVALGPPSESPPPSDRAAPPARARSADACLGHQASASDCLLLEELRLLFPLPLPHSRRNSV